MMHVSKSNSIVTLIPFHISVVFQAVKKNNITDFMHANDPVIFDEEDLDTRNTYNVTSGRFRAPWAGVYVFHWTCKTESGQMFRTGLYVNNGTGKVYNFASSVRIPNDDTGTQTYITRLNASDEVWIAAYELEPYLAGERWSTFSGYEL